MGNCYRWIALLMVGTIGAMVSGRTQHPAKGVQVIPDAANRKVEILIDGQAFTSYIYPATLKKPVLFPLRTAENAVVTRGFPPGPGERTDHPHHVGLWFNYGNVNGIDFWNNSDAIKLEDRVKMGTIVHRNATGWDPITNPCCASIRGMSFVEAGVCAASIALPR
jgi:hypothetical protein